MCEGGCGGQRLENFENQLDGFRHLAVMTGGREALMFVPLASVLAVEKGFMNGC